jgi:hypothetical protein
MSRYHLVLGVVFLGCGAGLGGCSSSDDGGGSDPTLSTLGKTVTKDAGSDAEEGFTPGLGCEGATLPTSTNPGGEITVLTCLNRRMPGTVPR